MLYICKVYRLTYCLNVLYELLYSAL